MADLHSLGEQRAEEPLELANTQVKPYDQAGGDRTSPLLSGSTAKSWAALLTSEWPILSKATKLGKAFNKPKKDFCFLLLMLCSEQKI